jgi:hypothetical protein
VTPTIDTPGLAGSWLNAWLAALGITVLVPHLRLYWSPDPAPHALFTPRPDPNHRTSATEPATVDDLGELIALQLPTVDALHSLAIAKHLDGLPSLEQRPTKTTFAARAQHARRTGDWTLAVLATDAVTDDKPANAPLNPPAPKGLTLHDRLVACRKALGTSPAPAITRTLTGAGKRVKMNGLGFDATRILIASDPKGDKWVDPAIETLAFFGLAFLPSRGDGTRRTTRGWFDAPSTPGALCWPAWHPALTAPAIDGLLDTFWNADAARRRRGTKGSQWRWPDSIGLVYHTVPYRWHGTMDPTRGYASEPLP